MKEIINKTTNFQKTVQFITFNIQNIPVFKLNKIELKNSYITDISTIKSHYKELFFVYFPFQTQNEINDDLLPPRIFFNSLNNPMYLLTENTQKEIKEYSPYLNFIKTLKFFGTLKQKKDKSVYLEIENDIFINLISNSLSKIEKLDNFNINIISKDEYKKKEVFEICKTDLNQKYEFKIKDLYSINVNDEEYTNKLLFLEIESKDLEEFRYKYHLFPKINGYNFSIVLGFKKYFKLRKSYPKMRINITFYAA